MNFDPAENTVNLWFSLINWLLVSGALAMLVLFISLMVLLLTRGTKGLAIFAQECEGMIMDLISLSPKRIWALTRLTFLEAYRRKALAVFVVFGLLFMFAGWFMGNTGRITPDQVKVYISFVLTSISWLTLPVVLILCCFGIPEDIRLRSIHTIVTKPARRVEIVIGRMIGISMIGSLVLAVMSVVGYIWIVRQLPASAQALLTCRVPIRGSISYIDRDGNKGESGVNVGDIWAFRSFIEGGTKARARWSFANFNESMLVGDSLNLENSFSGFRTHKGDMTRSLFYDIKLFNPDTNISYTTDPKTIDENRTKLDTIPRKVVTPDDKTYDIVKDFVAKDGSLNIEISCVDREQYIGVARSDFYIRMPDNHFWVGYTKAILGIGLTIILITMIGVSSSTIVKGPIASVLTFVFYLLSGKDAHKFMDKLVSNDKNDMMEIGGGALESIYRLFMHMAPGTQLPDNPAFQVIKVIDAGPTNFLWLCKQIIPRCQSFNMTAFVANGFDVPFDVSVFPSFLVVAAFFIPCVMLGYFSLRNRELETK